MLPDIVWKESSGLEKVWNDAGSRSPGDLTIWRAKLSTAEKNEGWRRLGETDPKRQKDRDTNR